MYSFRLLYSVCKTLLHIIMAHCNILPDPRQWEHCCCPSSWERCRHAVSSCLSLQGLPQLQQVMSSQGQALSWSGTHRSGTVLITERCRNRKVRSSWPNSCPKSPPTLKGHFSPRAMYEVSCTTAQHLPLPNAALSPLLPEVLMTPTRAPWCLLPEEHNL